MKNSHKVKIGISQCLTGAPVRFDGGHKNSQFCNEVLADVFQFELFCPEIAIGLPVPRKAIRLVGATDDPRAEYSNRKGQNENIKNFAPALKLVADNNILKLKQLSGFIFCKGSPSCGSHRVKVYNAHGQPSAKGVGIFAARVQQLLPNLPVEDDGRLNDALIRDSFIKRVFIYQQWQQILTQGLTPKALYEFHAMHKYTLLSHCQPTYRKIGAYIANVNQKNINAVAAEYFTLLMTGLSKLATRKNNTNVLMHLQGYLKKLLSAKDRAELRQSIIDYNNGLEPIMSPLKLLKHHFSHHPNQYIAKQSYLNPYPKALGIRVKMG